MTRSIVLLLVTAVVPAAAQQTTFRYRPPVGAPLVTLTEVRTVTTSFGLPALPDGAAFETEHRVSATQRVLQAASGAVTVEVTIDSIHARRRPLPEGVWSETAIDEGVGQAARATVDERFRVVGLTTTGDSDGRVLRMRGASFIGLGFGFPEAAVSVGETFETGATVQFDVELIPEAGLPLAETVLGDLRLTLDSVVATDVDELAFLSFRGRLHPGAPAPREQPRAAAVTFAGGFAGRLIWSAGWNAFVSGAARFQIQGQIRAETAGGATAAAAEWDVTITHRLRP